MGKKDDTNKFIKLINFDTANTRRLANDEDLTNTDRGSMTKHSGEYDKLLSAYTSHIEKTLTSKRRMKFWFYLISIIVLIVSTLTLIICVIYTIDGINNSNLGLLDYIPSCATALLSFLTVYIVIPKIIAKYLFNSHEEDVMKDIVTSIQEYDKQIRKKLGK